MTKTIRILLDSLIDYAGLFPPATLPMQKAVSNFSTYRGSDDAFALGRFIVPSSRIREFEDAARAHLTGETGWRLSVLAGNAIDDEVRAAREFNARHHDHAAIDTLEIKVTAPDEVKRAAKAVGGFFAPYFEIPSSADPRALLDVIREVDARAKIRTGGVTEEMIPGSAAVVQFLVACRERKLAFKATAGLHHPVRCVRPLTYETGAAEGTMHGFVNVFLAAALVFDGADAKIVSALLNDDEPSSFTFSDDAVSWKEQKISAATLEASRREFALSFGSCSFEEPFADLRQLGWIE